jgi:hypothetical protein
MLYSLSEDHHLEPLEVVELGSADSISGGLSEVTVSPLLSNAFLSDYLSNDSSASASTDGHLELCEAKPFDWNDLSSNFIAVDKYSVVIDDVNDHSEATLLSTIVNFGNAAHFDELSEGLHDDIFTIGSN